MRWTTKEDRLIAEALVKNNNEKTVAFQAVADVLGISRKAVASRYYRKFPDLDLLAKDIIEERAYKNYIEAHKPWYVKLWNTILNIFNKNQKP
ncbi:MAG: hypothetical protein SPJ62_07755 [Inconstantimicrobium porci]|uniref:hypothetical protein n=1 Tax=Inconstantimicrobium porci TaxID=2652291 RepID=UPI002A917AE4|nr:hypothetical protein [Inconstantimicrobium porci]MDY5911884.1 hypothetical protein [Inconstantimicrobium porci]